MSTALTKATPAPSLPAKIDAAWLATQKPWDVHEAVEASLMQSCGVKLRVPGTTWMRPQPTSSTPPDFAKALAIVEAVCAPASVGRLEAALAELSVQITEFGTSGAKADLQVEVYVRKLSGYPADIVLHVLDQWTKVSKPYGIGRDRKREWPAWGDLYYQLERAVEIRRNMIAALRAEMERGANKKAIAPPAR